MLDVVQLVEKMPGANEKVLALDHSVAAGGPATNAAVAHRARGGAATLLTRIPDHPLSAGIHADLDACGVTVVNAGAGDGAPVVASILVTAGSGDRAVVSAGGGSGAPSPSWDGAAIDVSEFGAVEVDGYHQDLALPLMAAARGLGIPVLLDAGSYKEHTEALLAHVDVAAVSADFHPPGAARTDEAVLEYLHENGVRFAVVTRGGDPLVYSVDGVVGEVEVPVVDAVDTLGAGDFFHGALGYELAEGGLVPGAFPAMLRRASEVAARSIQSFGTRRWLSAAPGEVG